MNSRRLSRILWLVAILSVAGLGLIMLSPVNLEGLAGFNVKPISVPGAVGVVDDAADVPMEQLIDIPRWNPFDPNGEQWTPARKQPVAAKKKQISAQQQVKVEGVTGILRLPGLQGVITDKGFIEVGEVFSGAEVRQVGDGEAVFSVSGKDELVIRINPQRDERRDSFRALGMPLFRVDQGSQSKR